MKIAQRVEGDVIVFLPEGRIDTQAATDMDQALQAAVSEGRHNLVVAGQVQGGGGRHEARRSEREGNSCLQDRRV